MNNVRCFIVVTALVCVYMSIPECRALWFSLKHGAGFPKVGALVLLTLGLLRAWFHSDSRQKWKCQSDYALSGKEKCIHSVLFIHIICSSVAT